MVYQYHDYIAGLVGVGKHYDQNVDIIFIVYSALHIYCI